MSKDFNYVCRKTITVTDEDLKEMKEFYLEKGCTYREAVDDFIAGLEDDIYYTITYNTYDEISDYFREYMEKNS